MGITENKRHNILLFIASVLFIIFATGLAVPLQTNITTTVIPSA